MKSRIQTAALLSAFIVFSAIAEEPKLDSKPSGLPDQEKDSPAKPPSKNKIEGETFLAQNAKTQGITVLPDGLQYRVIQTGTGETPKTNDLVFVKYRGKRIDGTEFDHHNRFLTRVDGGIKGWQDALQRMRVGSKLEIFVPPALAFGDEGEPYHHIEPDSTLIYELELALIAPPNPELGRGLGHAFDGDVASPSPGK